MHGRSKSKQNCKLYPLPFSEISWTLKQKGIEQIELFIRSFIEEKIDTQSTISQEEYELAKTVLETLLKNQNNIGKVEIDDDSFQALDKVYDEAKSIFIAGKEEISSEVKLIFNILIAYKNKNKFFADKAFQPYFLTYSQLTAEQLLTYPNALTLLKDYSYSSDIKITVFRKLLYQVEPAESFRPLSLDLIEKLNPGYLKIFNEELSKPGLTRKQFETLTRNFLLAYRQSVEDNNSSDTRNGHRKVDKIQAVDYLIENIEKLDTAFLTEALKNQNDYSGLKNGRLKEIVSVLQVIFKNKPYLNLADQVDAEIKIERLIDSLSKKNQSSELFVQLLEGSYDVAIEAFFKRVDVTLFVTELPKQINDKALLILLTERFISAYIQYLKSRLSELQNNPAEQEKITRSISMLEKLIAIKASWQAPEIALEHDEISKLMTEGVIDEAIACYELIKHSIAKRIKISPAVQGKNELFYNAHSYILAKKARIEIQNFIKVLKKEISSQELQLATRLVIDVLTRFENSNSIQDIEIGECHIKAWLACRKELEINGSKSIPRLEDRMIGSFSFDEKIYLSQSKITAGFNLLDYVFLCNDSDVGKHVQEYSHRMLSQSLKPLADLTPEEWLVNFKKPETIEKIMLPNKTDLQFRFNVVKLLLLESDSHEKIILFMQDYKNFMNALVALQSVLSEDLIPFQRKVVIQNFLKAYQQWVENYKPADSKSFDKERIANALKYLLDNINHLGDKENDFFESALKGEHQSALTFGRLDEVINVLRGQSIGMKSLSEQLKNKLDAPFILEEVLSKNELAKVNELFSEGNLQRFECLDALFSLIEPLRKGVLIRNRPLSMIIEYMTKFLECYVTYLDNQINQNLEDTQKDGFENEKVISEHLLNAIKHNLYDLSEYKDYQSLMEMIGKKGFGSTLARVFFLSLIEKYPMPEVRLQERAPDNPYSWALSEKSIKEINAFKVFVQEEAEKSSASANSGLVINFLDELLVKKENLKAKGKQIIIMGRGLRNAIEDWNEAFAKTNLGMSPENNFIGVFLRACSPSVAFSQSLKNDEIAKYFIPNSQLIV